MNAPTRRETLKSAAGALAGLTIGSVATRTSAETPRSGVRVSMYDASMGCRSDIKSFARAKEVGLDGVQVNICSNERPFNLRLRSPEVQEAFRAEARKNGIVVSSIAMGVLNNVPLKSEPRAALWVADTLKVARNLGARNVMLACFGRGRLDENDKDAMKRVVDVLRELAPRAAEAKVVIGLENTLSAEANLEVIKQVGSRWVQVYYDVCNMVNEGNDPLHEIKLLGKEHICDCHFKEGGHFLGASGKPDWPATAAALRAIGYDGWITLETSNPTRDVVADTRRNVKYVRELFATS